MGVKCKDEEQGLQRSYRAGDRVKTEVKCDQLLEEVKRLAYW